MEKAEADSTLVSRGVVPCKRETSLSVSCSLRSARIAFEPTHLGWLKKPCSLAFQLVQSWGQGHMEFPGNRMTINMTCSLYTPNLIQVIL